jgi:hypothetical protein
MIRRLAPLLLIVFSSANAQQFKTGQILTAAELNNAFALVLPVTGGSLTGPLTVPTLTVTGVANIPNISVSGGTISNATITGGTISGLSSPIAVASGGTGANTFTAHGVLVGSGAGALAAVGPGTSGQPLVSGGAGANPSYSALALSGLAAQAANTVVANVTASSASPTAVALPSCSTGNSALQYTSATGFSCGTSFALTSGTLAQFAATTSAQLAGIISDETGSGSLVFGTNPTIGTATINTPTLSGGTINNASVGATTPSTGAFTTLSASSTVSGSGFSSYLASPPAIGGTAANAGKFTTLQATSAITPSSSAGIVGTNTNDNANAGSFGEYASNTTTGTSLTTTVMANATSVSLTAGDWDVSGTVFFNPAGTTTVSGLTSGISTTSATFSGLGTLNQLNATFGTGLGERQSTPVVRISVASTTTVYLVAQASFGTSTMTCDGFIRARRVR